MKMEVRSFIMRGTLLLLLLPAAAAAPPPPPPPPPPSPPPPQDLGRVRRSPACTCTSLNLSKVGCRLCCSSSLYRINCNDGLPLFFAASGVAAGHSPPLVPLVLARVAFIYTNHSHHTISSPPCAICAARHDRRPQHCPKLAAFRQRN